MALRDKRIAPPRVKIGGSVTLSFTLVNKQNKPQRVMVDLVVHFVKARGTGAKTFKMKALTLAPGARVTVTKKIGLRQLTTRKHYPGVHKVEALLNGRRVALGGFTLLRFWLMGTDLNSAARLKRVVSSDNTKFGAFAPWYFRSRYFSSRGLKFSGTSMVTRPSIR